MDLEQLSQSVGNWLAPGQPAGDVVISSRVRLARNVDGFRFCSHADDLNKASLLDYLKTKIDQAGIEDDLWFIDVQDISATDRQLLTERHLISKQLAQEKGPRAVALREDESFAVMINEEDHLRLQSLAPGLQLDRCYKTVNHIDDLLEKQLNYAFSDTYGYLTACPTNVGTGIRVSVMLHLPALKMTQQMERVFRAIKDMKLTVRGLYGEGSDPIGDLFQLSNQITLGKSEQQIIKDVTTQAVEPLIEYERRARQTLLEERPVALDDKIFRAIGILSNARQVSSEETLYLLSYLRLGIHLKRIKHIPLDTVNRIFLLTQPAHLQKIYRQKLDPSERDEMRAEFIRKLLNKK